MLKPPFLLSFESFRIHRKYFSLLSYDIAVESFPRKIKNPL